MVEGASGAVEKIHNTCSNLLPNLVFVSVWWNLCLSLMNENFFKVLFSVRLLLNDSIQVELILFTVVYLLRDITVRR